MIKNFKKELNLISSNKRISEKLMVIAIYNEFINDILDATDDNSKQQYINIMEKAFEATVRYFNNYKTRNVDAKRFMSVYFGIIRENKSFNKAPFIQVINTIESRLDDYNNIMDFVNVVDNFEELLLDRKVSIMLQYREYANSLLNAINEMFGCNTAKSNELHYSILTVLKNRLANYIKYCKANNISSSKTISNLNINMINPVKNMLLQKIGNYSLGVQDIQDEATYEFLGEFQDLEQCIWMMEYIYEITGCNKNAKSLNLNKPKEICELLGISKLRYTLTNVSMNIHSLRIASKQKNNMTR